MSLVWTRSELLVVLLALHDNGWAEAKEKLATIAAISKLLRLGAFHGSLPRPSNFRSLSSIHLKAENLRTVKGTYGGAEMHGSKADLAIVSEYETEPLPLLNEARGVRLALEALLATQATGT